MNFTSVEDDPYQIVNSCASQITESVSTFINKIHIPPESLYYAAEYIRLQSEIDKWKEKVTHLETESRKESENDQIQVSLENELRQQEKFDSEKKKLMDFYETGITLLRQQNRDLENKNNKQLKTIKTLNEQLKFANVSNESKTATWKAKVDKLKVSENKLKKTVKTLLGQDFIQERKPNGYIKDLRKNRTCTNRRRNEKDLSVSILDNSTDANNSKTFPNDEQHPEEHNNIYQPMSSPVTPIAQENQERENVITHDNVTTNNSTNETRSTLCLPSPKLREHYEILSLNSSELDLEFMCACGKKFDTIGKLRIHLTQTKNGRVHNCRICKKGFLTHQTLKNHYKNLHGTVYQYGRYGCGYCGRTFSSAKLMRQHKVFEHFDVN